MKRSTTLFLVVALSACGGGEPAENAAGEPAAAPAAAAPAATAMGEMSVPDWMHVDQANRVVHLTVTAGLTDAKNYWNFNGGHDGNMTITVPEGFAVTVDLVNSDPVMAHSLGIAGQTSGFGAMLDPVPAFEGAITSNPTSMTDATMPGESESITFTATAAGNYAMVCFIPGHAATGMWVLFNVSADGSAGVQTAM